MNGIRLAFVTCLLLSTGCATPPEIKQALIAKDQAYAENTKLMEQYRNLVMNVHDRHRYWYRYVQTRLLLDLALQWATTDPKLSKVPEQDIAEDDAALLGPEVTALVNTARLRTLPERKGRKGVVLFQAGSGDLNKLIQTLPSLVALVEQRVKSQSQSPTAADMTAFDDYRTNVAALQRINAMIKRYLDIDVTVKQDDLKQLADAIKTLR
jgi:hypothetical protein